MNISKQLYKEIKNIKYNNIWLFTENPFVNNKCLVLLFDIITRSNIRLHSISKSGDSFEIEKNHYYVNMFASMFYASNIELLA